MWSYLTSVKRISKVSVNMPCSFHRHTPNFVIVLCCEDIILKDIFVVNFVICVSLCISVFYICFSSPSSEKMSSKRAETRVFNIVPGSHLKPVDFSFRSSRVKVTGLLAVIDNS